MSQLEQQRMKSLKLVSLITDQGNYLANLMSSFFSSQFGNAISHGASEIYKIRNPAKCELLQ